MLKQNMNRNQLVDKTQPPSGGCVLKLVINDERWMIVPAAAFGRLCVETQQGRGNNYKEPAAAFGRLCVETCKISISGNYITAAAFGRLCVETKNSSVT